MNIDPQLKSPFCSHSTLKGIRPFLIAKAPPYQRPRQCASLGDSQGIPAVKALLNAKATVDPDNSAWTWVMKDAVTTENQHEMLKILVQAGVRTDYRYSNQYTLEQTLLHLAPNVAVIKTLLPAMQKDINVLNHLGMTVLGTCCRDFVLETGRYYSTERLPIVRALLQAKADPNIHKKGYDSPIDTLAGYGGKPNKSPADKAEREEMIETLLHHGSKPTSSILYREMSVPSTEYDWDRVRRLLLARSDPSKWGSGVLTNLFNACCADNSAQKGRRVLKLLVDLGVTNETLRADAAQANLTLAAEDIETLLKT